MQGKKIQGIFIQNPFPVSMCEIPDAVEKFKIDFLIVQGEIRSE